ncbi:hypothetical protein ACFWHR_03095 [Leucobacter sp. NPDC058333]|uniref:hypothetical protein n=1 Tax=Leucobacter sp. NPDC058333 TaxID=3346450 RepID=UPI00364DD5C3
MGKDLRSESGGIWIVQALGEDEGRILALCGSVEEAESVTDELADFFSDMRYAFFPFNHRFGRRGNGEAVSAEDASHLNRPL